MEPPWPSLSGPPPPQPLTASPAGTPTSTAPHGLPPQEPPAPTHTTVASLQATAGQCCQGPVVQAQGFTGDVLERGRKTQTPGTGQAQSQLNQ